MMKFNRGDRVLVYENDLMQYSRLGTIIAYRGHDKLSRHHHLVKFDKGGATSTVSEEWLTPYEPPVMDDTRNYLDALAELS